jgi:serine protease Do
MTAPLTHSGSRMAKKLRVLSASLALGASLVAMHPLPALAQSRTAPLQESFADLVDKLQPAVVNISTTQKVEVNRTRSLPGLPPGHPLEELFRRLPRGGNNNQQDQNDDDDRPPNTREARSLGSGFVIDASGFIVTNNHVVTGQDQQAVVDKITVTFADGTEYEAKLVGRDQPSDLALLKIEPKGPIPFVRFGDSSKVRVGDWAIAIGNPFGLGSSVTAGIVSALHRPVGPGFDFYIQTDASINRGNSGGPLFNNKGDVIGINTAIFSPSGGNVGIGFSIPSSYAARVIDQLRKTGRVRRAWLGVQIQEIDDDFSQALGLRDKKGALVANTTPDTPGSKAGLKAGDVITTFNGRAISRSSELPLIVSETTIGSTVDVVVIRDGKPTTIKVTLEERPNPTAQADEAKKGEEAEKPAESAATRQSLGITLSPLTDEIRRRLKLDTAENGVLIASVNASSDAATKGLRIGDLIIEINNTPITSPEQAAKIVAEARKANRQLVLLRIKRGDDVFLAPVKLQPQR